MIPEMFKKKISVAKIEKMSLHHNFSWMFIGNLVYVLSQWGMLVFLAKYGSIEMVGLYSLGLAITAPIIVFSNLQLRSIQATDAKTEFNFNEYLSVRLIMVTLAMIIISLIVILGDYKQETIWIILLIGLAKVLESISDIFHGLLQQKERMDYIGKSLILKGPTSLLALMVALWLTKSLIIAVVALCLVWFLRLLLYDLPKAGQYSFIKPQFNIMTSKKIIMLTLPLGIVSLLNSLNVNIPRYFVEHFEGLEQLGYFAAISYIMLVGNLIISSLGQAASPRLARYLFTGDTSSFKRLLMKLLLIGLLLGLIGIIVVYFYGNTILTIIYNPDFTRYNYIFILLMVASAIGYVTSLLNIGIVVARYIRIQPILSVVVLSISIVSCFMLVPKLGLIGAAYAVIITFLIQFIGNLCIILYILFNYDHCIETNS